MLPPVRPAPQASAENPAGGAGTRPAPVTGPSQFRSAESPVMSSSLPTPTSGCRGEARPVRRRTRTFRPNYLSFAGTYQCNLACPHCCVPIEWPDRLEVAVALRFLEEARQEGVEVLGFTGGEPFLYPEFVVALTRRGA